MNNNESQVILRIDALIRDNTPEGMEVDEEESTNDKIVFKKKVKSTRWEDLEYISGFFSSTDSCLLYTSPSPRDS